MQNTVSAGNCFRFLLIFFLLGRALFPENIFTLTFPDDETGNAAMADRYAIWSKNLIEDGYWSEALFALERAADFADVSSDISYLLALARSHGNRGRDSILAALENALLVDRWVLYDSEDARLFKIENLITLRFYNEALFELSRVSSSPREAELSLKALAFKPPEFRRVMAETLARYPRETGPVRIFLQFLSNIDAAGRNPDQGDLDLLELIIRRLPVLLPDDPALAWMAAPFMRDTDEARRLVLAYRALNTPDPASLPAALKLGVIDEEIAMNELFAPDANARAQERKPLDLSLLNEVWGLLRNDGARTQFGRNLSAYTGVITEDADRDGFPETIAEYHLGMLRRSTYDTRQEGTPELEVFYEGGNPLLAFVLLPPGTERQMAELKWERYPSVLDVELDGVRFIPRPLEFHFSPIRFVEILGSGVFFPQRDSLTSTLTKRVLVMQSFRVERPSNEFRGGRELVEIERGIPVRAREFVGDLMVSETDFLRGRPQLQRLDLDFDGCMDTFRFFRRPYRPMEIEDLWDYDRDFERVESDWDIHL